VAVARDLRETADRRAVPDPPSPVEETMTNMNSWKRSGIYLGLLGLVAVIALLAVTADTDAQRPPTKPGHGPRPTAKALPKRLVRVVHPKGVNHLAVGSVFSYPMAVNFEGGNGPLPDENNQPLHVSQVRVWAPRVLWRSSASSPFITVPQGLGTPAPGNYLFPGFNNEGIVIYQPIGGIAQNVLATTQQAAQSFQFSNGFDIYANVNDARGGYGDNNGDFTLALEVLGL
jgi:hypothetical protein